MAHSSGPGEIIGHATTHIVGAVSHSVVAPVMREMEYEVNQFAPNLWPEVGELCELFYQGRVSRTELDDALAFHGICSTSKRGYAKESVLWDNVIDVHRPAFEPALARSLLRQNVIGEYAYRWHVSRHGMYDKDLSDQFLLESEILSPQELVIAWQRGFVDEIQLAGWLKARGFVEPMQVDLLKRLSFEIPSPSDLVHFSIREIWDPDVTERFGHDDEFRPQFQFWMERQGAGGDARTPIEVASGADPFTWAQAHWRAHWVTIAPGQAYTFQQRLRPGRVEIFRDQFPNIVAWTPEDTRLALKAQDYPPPFRDRLAAISYNVLGRIDTRRLYQSGIIDDKEVDAIYQDMGYSARDAGFLTTFTVKQDRIRRSKLVRTDTKAKVLAAYDAGIIDRDDALIQLHRVGLEDPLELDAYDNLPEADRLAEARVDFNAEMSINQVETEQRLKKVLAWQRVLRNRFLKGLASRNETETDLAALGLTPAKIDDLLALWGMELTLARKQATAAQALRWMQKGIITLGQAQIRLTNLGYSQEDINGMLIETQMGMQLSQAKQLAAAAKDSEAKQKAIVAAQRAMRAQQRQLQSDLARHGSPPQLRDWFVSDLISEQDFRDRLGKLGWPADDINRAFQAAGQKKGQRAGKAAGTPLYPKSAGTGHPSAADLAKEYSGGFLPLPNFRSELEGLGWTKEEVDAFIAKTTPP